MHASITDSTLRPERNRLGLSRLAVALLAALAMLTTMLFTGQGPAAAADDPCGPNGNPVACENTLPGTNPGIWDIDGAGDPTIQGYATQISVDVGERIDFKIDTNASNYTIRIFRTGWYQGMGARLVDTIAPSATLPQLQPQCITDVATELYDCGNWGVSASWQVPSDAVSGVYIALIRRSDTGGDSHIIFVVRDDDRPSDVLFQTSDTTWQAYNSYGGSSFYVGGANGRGYKLSYNRPFNTREGTTKRDFYFSSEYAQVRFLERNGYDVTYLSGVDSDRNGSLLLDHNVFLSVGHDEYWSGQQRTNVEAARDAGVNMQFLTGNEVYWRTRWEPAASSDGTPYRTLVSYKETWGDAKIDPASEWTGTWRDPRFASQAQGGGLPENALTGTMYTINHSDLPITVSATEGKNRLWRHTSLATMGSGQSAALAPHTVGYESNEVVDNGFSPPGLIRLSTTVGDVPEVLQDYGNIVMPGSTTHHVTMYRAASGALVFSSASVQWAWGLDQQHDGEGAPADPRMQQAQVNLLADMGAMPVSLMSGLVAATASTDTAGPTVTITTPVSGATIANGTLVTVAGTAVDVGGVVAGVEVSTDGGQRWHAASGTTQWSYSYVQHGMDAQAIRVRAVDDSANIGAVATVPLNVPGPYSAFGETEPAVIDSGDTSSVELGLRFTTQLDGFISGVRFHKAPANGGVHTGSLWDAAGNRLATVVFSAETAAGWQTAYFETPVAVAKDTTYVVSYTAPQGRYSNEQYYWPYAATDTSPFTIASGFGAAPAGVYGVAGTFPNLSYRSGNYFVDAVFDTTANVPLAAIGQWPVDGATDVPTASSVSARFSADVVPSSVSLTVSDQLGASVAGSVVYEAATRTVRFTPTTALPTATLLTVVVDATAVSGGALATGGSWSFTTVNPSGEPVCPCTLFPPTSVPTILEVADNGPVTLGVRFTPLADGVVTGIRFYKGAGNTGTHVGSLWTAGGQQLASATFVNESTSGWQTVHLGQAVPVQAGTEYIAAYRTTVGAYSATLGAFADAGFTRGPLRVGTNAGAFTYATGFPGSVSTTNYHVDVVFDTDATAQPPVSVVGTTPTAGQTGVATSTMISAVLSAAPESGTPAIEVTGPAGPIAGTLAWDASTRTIGFTPAAALSPSTAYQVTVSIDGAVAAGGVWSFTTSAPPAWDGQYSLLTGQTPVVASVSDDTAAVELGMSFSVSQPGSVTGIRFYKGPGNGGTHTGSLWTSTGTRLATVTFAGETASGWQTAMLSSPVVLTPGERYVVSYLAPQGRYSVTTEYFTTLRTNGPITADTAVNGRFRYGAGGGFPSDSWKASSYFVDIIFVTGTTAPPPVDPITITSRTPAPGAVGVAPSISVSATVSAVSPTGTPVIELNGPSGAVPGTTGWNPATLTATFTPAQPLAWATGYTATVAIGGAGLTQGTWSFTTAAEPVPSGTFTLHGTTTPPTVDSGDTQAVELGTVFTVSQPGSVTGIRFYKSSANTGIHIGTLWSLTGQQLARVTFTGETASGWQTANLSTPVALTPGERYIVSYFAPAGRYSVASGWFTTQRTNGPIVAEVNQNGRFRYGNPGGFPTGTWNSASYFVDVVFTTADVVPPTPDPEPTPITVGTRTPASGATGVAPTAAVSAVLNGVPAGVTPTLSVTAPSGAVAGASAWNAAASTVTFTPGAALAWSTSHQVTVTVPGATVTGATWSFTTIAAPPDPEPTPVALVSSTPAAGVSGVAPTAPVSAVLTGVTAGMTPTLALTRGGTAVAGTSAWNAASATVTFTPAAALAWSAAHQATVSIGGTAVTGASWSFTTVAAPPEPEPEPTPVTLTSRTPAASTVEVAPTTPVAATLSGVPAGATPVLALSAPSGPIAGSSTWDLATATVTFTPTTPLAWLTVHTANVTVPGAAVSGASWSFTTADAPQTVDVVSLFSLDSVPDHPAWDDPASVQVAVRFTTSVAGTVTGIRFYKGAVNTGVHTGSLWDTNGSRLAQVTFVDETESGWQTALFSTPVTLQPGVEYRAGLHSSTGRYALTIGGLTDPFVNGPLSTLANGGAYTYGTEYPGATSAHNFWTDVLFDPSP